MKELRKYLRQKAIIEAKKNLPERSKKVQIFNLWVNYVNEYSTNKKDKEIEYIGEKIRLRIA
jgi:hypothetical protein